MIFCPKCGEAIPDNSITCSKCGETLKSSESEQAVVYASQKQEKESASVVASSSNTKNGFIAWGILSVLFLVFLKLNYMSISVDLYYGGSSDTSYTGYYLTQCLEGTARLSGIMVMVLIVIACAGIITAVLGTKGGIVKKSLLKALTLIEALSAVIVTIIPFFHLRNLLAEFDSSISTASIGMGCYLNIAVAVIMLIIYFNILSSLKD